MAEFIENLKTLTGFLVTTLLGIFDEELPEKAYTSVPGASDLTDIKPAWMNEYFNRYFGLCGLGWGLDYAPEALTISAEKRTTSSGRERTVFCAVLKKATFWYILTDDAGNRTRCEIQTSGGSENDILWYAMKGALTSATGNAASKIGWQASVYKDERSHHNVGKKERKAEPFQHPSASAQAKPAAAVSQPRPAASVKAAAPAPVNAVAQAHAPVQAHAPAPAPVASLATPAVPATEIHPSPTMGKADPAPAAPASAAAAVAAVVPAAVAESQAPAAPKKAWKDTALNRSDGPFARMINAGKAAGIRTFGQVTPAYIFWDFQQNGSQEDKETAKSCLKILFAESPAEFPAEWKAELKVEAESK